MTRILRLDAPIPADDMGWVRDALLQGHGVAAVRAFLGYADGAALADGQLPQGLRIAGPVADLFWTRSGLLVASAALREAIEVVEPGRHRFWPLAVFQGERLRHGWSGLIVRATGKAISEARSLCHIEPAVPRLGLPRHVTLVDHRAGIDPARLPEAHLWWDRALSKPYLMVSEMLAPAVEMLDGIAMRDAGG